MRCSFGSAIIASLEPELREETALNTDAEKLSAGVLSRSAGSLEDLFAEHGTGLLLVLTDVTDTEAMEASEDHVGRKLGPLKSLSFKVSAFLRGPILDFDPNEFESAWRVDAYCRSVFEQTVARQMVVQKKGTIIPSDVTGALRADAASFGFSGSKFGLRTAAQYIPRELGQLRKPIVQVIIDGVIRGHKHDDPVEDAHMQPKTLLVSTRTYAKNHARHGPMSLMFGVGVKNSGERRSYD